jgi:hypothetical protein
MVLPDYRASIVNLTASLAQALGCAPSQLPLAGLEPERLVDARRIVLLVVDGLGYEYLQARSGCLRTHLHSQLTSVFPSTTASAIPAFLTGLPPSQHALTGWHMYFRELGTIAATLPFRSRIGHQPLAAAGITPQQLYGLTPLFDRLAVPSHVVSPHAIVHSDFNAALAGKAVRHGYGNLAEMFALMTCLVRGPERRAYIHAYWPDLDSLAHAHGIASPLAAAAFAALDAAFGQFVESLRNTGTVVLVTADHGFIDTTPADTVDLDDHPELRQTLVLPLCGEPRVAYAYVQSGGEGDFEGYVQERLADRVACYRSQELIEQGWFGPGPIHTALPDRVGDYTLVAKGRTILRDWLPGEERYVHVGVHGGVSAEEMQVPLVVVWPG